MIRKRSLTKERERPLNVDVQQITVQKDNFFKDVDKYLQNVNELGLQLKGMTFGK